MTKFLSVAFLVMALVGSACAQQGVTCPENAGEQQASAPEATAATVTEQHPTCVGTWDTTVEVRGIPVPQRRAFADSIKARVDAGTLPDHSESYHEGQAEARWRRVCRPSG